MGFVAKFIHYGFAVPKAEGKHRLIGHFQARYRYFQVIRAFRVSKLGQKQQRYTRFCSEFKLPQIMNHNSWHIGDDSTNAICLHNFDHLTWIDTLRIDSDTLRVIGVLGMSKSRQKCRKIQILLRSILMTPSGPMLAYFLAIFPQNIWALAFIWFSRII